MKKRFVFLPSGNKAHLVDWVEKVKPGLRILHTACGLTTSDKEVIRAYMIPVKDRCTRCFKPGKRSFK